MSLPLLRLLHVAGVHLAGPVRDLEGLPEDTALIAADAAEEALRNLTAAAVREAVDAVVLAGDTFHEADRSLAARVAIVAAARELHEHGIPLVVVPGQHDPLPAWEAIDELPGNVRIARLHQPLQIPVEGPLAVTLTAVSSVAHELPAPPAAGTLHLISCPAEAWETARRHTATQAETTPNGKRPHHLPGQGCTAVLLSGRHQRTHHREAGTVAHHPGTPVPLSATDHGPHGGSIVEVNESGRVECRPVTLSPVRFEKFSLTVDSRTNADTLRTAIQHQLSQLTWHDSEELWHIHWQVTVDRGTPEQFTNIEHISELAARAADDVDSVENVILAHSAAISYVVPSPVADSHTQSNGRSGPFPELTLPYFAALHLPRDPATRSPAATLPELPDCDATQLRQLQDWLVEAEQDSTALAMAEQLGVEWFVRHEAHPESTTADAATRTDDRAA